MHKGLPRFSLPRALAQLRCHARSAFRFSFTVSRSVAHLIAVSLLLHIAQVYAAAPADTLHPGTTSQATSTGGVPAPGPATVFNPNTLNQPVLAVVLPDTAASAAKASETYVLTTADAGTVIPGGRRQTLTFAQLGALDPLQLRGTEGQNGVPFSVRNDEVVTGAVLHLIYSYSPALLPSISQLKVLVNGEIAATLPVPREQAGMLVARDVSIDPRFITEFNHVNVQLVGHYALQCEDPANSTLWATVSNLSSLDLTYASLTNKADLSTLPQPFFDPRDVRRLELPFVFDQNPSMPTLEAAGAVASWLGGLAGYRGAIFPAFLDTLPLSGNAVVFATSEQHPAGVTIPPIQGPTLAIVDRQAPARGKLLLVLGRTDAELKIAAAALALGQPSLSGETATITQLRELTPRQPYDAPNWLASDRPVHFGELSNARDLTATGYYADAIRLNLRLPPDLFIWHSKGVPVDLHYRYTPRPNADRSALNVSVNDDFVQSLPIPPKPSNLFGLGRYLAQILPEQAAATQRRIYLPPQLLSSHAQLRLHFYYDMPKTDACQSSGLDDVVGSVDSDSTIDLSSFPHYMALPDLAAFANSGFPFTRLADLSQTAVILPDHPGPADYSLYLLAMGRLGAFTGYPATAVTVGHATQVDQFADKDLLVLGAPGEQPLLQSWARAMPFSGDAETRSFALSDLVLGLKDWWHGPHGPERTPARADLTLVSNGDDALISGFESPLRAGRSAVALISGAGESSQYLANALLDADLVPDIQGAMVVVHGHAVTVTSNGNAYYVGHLWALDYLRWTLSLHPFLVLLGSVLAALIIAALFYRALRAVAARRLKD